MPRPARENLFRSAGVVSAAIFLSRISGLVREQVMGALFGASSESDAFVVAVRIPNLMRDLFAEGALSSAFIPAFTRSLANDGKAAAAKLSNLVAGSLVAIVGSICLLGMIFSPQLVQLFASGYREIPGKFELTVQMTRIMFPFLLLVALAAQAMGILNALNQFGVAALSSTFFNVGSVVFGLSAGYLIGPRFGISPIVGMAYGVLCGGAWQLLWQIPSLIREGLAFRPTLAIGDYFAHPGLRQIFLLMGPALLGNAATQINVTVNTNFATSITDAAGQVLSGPASWLQYAFRFMQLPLGVFGVAIASATLPSVSRSAAAGDMVEFRRTMARSLGIAMLLTVPSSVGLVVLGPSMIGVVYERGAFHAQDTHQTAVALSCYALGLASYSALKILAPAFYALNDARTPMLVSLGSIAVNYGVAYFLVKRVGMGHAGLAFSTSMVSIFGSVALFLALRRRIGGMEGRRLSVSAAKICAAAAVMGAACMASSSFILGSGFDSPQWARVLDLAVSAPLGLLVFYGVSRALRVEELEAAMAAAAGPLARRFGFAGRPKGPA